MLWTDMDMDGSDGWMDRWMMDFNWINVESSNTKPKSKVRNAFGISVMSLLLLLFLGEYVFGHQHRPHQHPMDQCKTYRFFLSFVWFVRLVLAHDHKNNAKNKRRPITDHHHRRHHATSVTNAGTATVTRSIIFVLWAISLISEWFLLVFSVVFG